MKYIDEFRDGAIAKKIQARLHAEAQPGRLYSFMEFCGGHTHAIRAMASASCCRTTCA